MFKPDQPIETKKDDILGRGSFAQKLGDAILQYEQEDSLVLGLLGTWGSGKTSILNMTLEHIESFPNAEKRPVIIKFNPWNYSDQNQLIAQFFKELSLVLCRDDSTERHAKLGRAIQKYSRFFEPFSYVPTLSAIGGVAKAVKSVGIAAEKAGEESAKNLSTVKSELNSLLKKIDKKLIIVIDDIDRLNNTETRQIFQLIKSLADFKNTVYMLAFDKDVVINALKEMQKGFGLEYLEKVIQVPIEVPLISENKLQKFFFKKLDEIVADIPQDKFDKTYWGNIYHSGIRYFFKNIRHINRYMNLLRTEFELVKGNVNTIDFIAITAIKVFLPDVYVGIRDNKDIFAGALVEDQKQQYVKRCDEIINRAKDSYQDKLKELLKYMFPKLRAIYGNVYSSSYGWKKEGRICSKDIFDLFFMLSIPEEAVPLSEIEAILSLANDKQAFESSLLGLNKDGRIKQFLLSLQDYTESDISIDNIGNIITVLMNIGDLFPEEDDGFYSLGTSTEIRRIILQLSKRLENQEERFKVFDNAIQSASKSINTITGAVTSLGYEHGKFTSEPADPEEERRVDSKQLEILEDLACQKIKIWANNGHLLENRRLDLILFDWKRWAGAEDVNKFVKESIKSNEGLFKFIIGFLSKVKVQSVGDYTSKIEWQMNLKNIKEFIEINKIEPRLRKIATSKKFESFDDKTRLAIDTFLGVFDGKIKLH